ncbi:MAG: hypothetical protein RIQ93_1807 [Verrucomicrobiota bacterium]|jgi:uncharacterized protein (TIGR03067 family)
MSDDPPSPPIEGAWLMIRAELEGEEAPEAVAQKTVLAFASGNYSVSFAGEVMDRGTYELGGTLEGRTIVLIGESGPNAGRTIPGIYQLAGDRLRVCYGLDCVAPTDYETNSGDQRYLAIYRRIQR